MKELKQLIDQHEKVLAQLQNLSEEIAKAERPNLKKNLNQIYSEKIKTYDDLKRLIVKELRETNYEYIRHNDIIYYIDQRKLIRVPLNKIKEI